MYIKSVQRLFCFLFLFFIQFPILGESRELTLEQQQAVEEFCRETLKHIHGLKPSKQEQIITIIDDSPLPMNSSKVDIEKALNFITDKSYLYHSRIETDVFLIPNYRYSKFEIEWKSVSNGNKTLKVKDFFNAKDNSIEDEENVD